jgi:hypothetical protein
VAPPVPLGKASPAPPPPADVGGGRPAPVTESPARVPTWGSEEGADLAESRRGRLRPSAVVAGVVILAAVGAIVAVLATLDGGSSPAAISPTSPHTGTLTTSSAPSAAPSPAGATSVGPPVTSVSAPQTTANLATTPAPDPELAALEKISSLLDTSVTIRGRVIPAVDGVLACNVDPGAAAATLSAAATDRGILVARLKALPLLVLPAAAHARAVLELAWAQSRVSDLDYAKWARVAQSSGCHPNVTTSAAFKAGQASDKKADAVKAEFITVWNGLATLYHLPARTAIQF